MPHAVVLTEGATRDLEELFEYIESHDSFANAVYVLGSDEMDVVLHSATIRNIS